MRGSRSFPSMVGFHRPCMIGFHRLFFYDLFSSSSLLFLSLLLRRDLAACRLFRLASLILFNYMYTGRILLTMFNLVCDMRSLNEFLFGKIFYVESGTQ